MIFTGRHVRLFVYVCSGFLFLASVSASDDDDATAPPSIQDIIEHVQQRNQGIRRAVVRIKPGSGAPDGGGRLYWERGSFVRMRNYRITSNGRLHLYESVTEPSRTSFVFNTNHADGTSFTFGLQFPHDRIPDAGYGLLDYFQLEFAAERGVDVKYPGYLMALNLFPQRLKLYGDRYERSLKTVGNQRYVVLRRKKVMIRDFYFTETLYLNTSSWRFEKVVLRERSRRYIMTAPSFQDVNGVSVPRSVNVTSPGFGTPFGFTLRYDVRWKDVDAGDVRKPTWLDDPGLPVVSDVRTRQIHRKIRRNNVDATFYKDLIHGAIRYRYMLFPSHFHARPFRTSVERASKQHPDSRLLKAYLDGIYSSTRADQEDEVFLTAFSTIQDQVEHPYMNYAAAFRALINDAPNRTQSYLQPIQSMFPYGHVARRLRLLRDLRNASTGKKFDALLRKYYIGVKPSNHIGRVKALHRVIHKQKKKEWIRVIKKRLKEHDAPLLLLTLAKYYESRKNYKRTNQYYARLADKKAVRRILFSYIQSAGENAKPVIRKLPKEDIPLVWILLRIASLRVRRGRTKEAIDLIDRVLERLKDGDRNAIGGIPPDREDTYLSRAAGLIRRLLPDETKRMRLLALRLVRTDRRSWDNARFVEALQRLTAESERARYRLSRALLLQANAAVADRIMPRSTFQSQLIERLDGENRSSGVRDYIALSKGIAHGWFGNGKEGRLRRMTEFLNDGLSRFPNHEKRPFLLDALGTLHYRLGEYNRAARAYIRLMTFIRSSEPPELYEYLFHPVSEKRFLTIFQGETASFQSDDPVIVKLAHCIRSADRSSRKAYRMLSSYAILYSHGTAEALAFKIIGRDREAIQLLIHRYRQARSESLSRTLMEILVKLLRQRNEHVKVAMVYLIALKEKNVTSERIKKGYKKARTNIDRNRLIEELKKQEYTAPSPRVKRLVRHYLEKLDKADSKKQRMKFVSRILRMESRAIPVLLEHRDHSSKKIRTSVSKMLETLRIRQIKKEFLPRRQVVK